ncbi:glycosyltransferase family 4 protein [Sphingorhabdus sp.]|uniref:glycosyltransferase family 4 protein n=2 Tax=Sphingorhabdus sp. TaxID=1902408 RepID=UPI003BB0F50D
MPGRPRILHIFSTFDHGGAEARTVSLINHWGNRINHAIWAGVPKAIGARAAIDPEIDVTFPEQEATLVLGPAQLTRYYRIARMLRGYNLILTYSWGAMDVVMAHRIFARRLHLPPLIHHEDGYTESEPGFENWRRHFFRRMALQSAHALVVPSQMLVSIARAKWHVRANKIRRIANGIDVAAFHRKADPKAIPGFIKRPGSIVVGTVAGLREVKNLPKLVRAVAVTELDLELVIVGEGPERDVILSEAKRCGIADRVHLSGFLNNPASFIGLFDIFALSSDSEQYPLAVVEAMAAGLPVVSTDVGDLRQMLSEQNLPFLIDCNEEAKLATAIARLATDPALRKRLGKDNRDQADRFGQKATMIAAYEQLYGSAMQGRNPWRAERG